MAAHCIYCKKEVKKNGKKRRRFCKGTECQKKYRLEKYRNVIPTTELKTCSECGYDKPGDKFYIDRGTKDGRTYRCKSCIDEYGREHGKGKGTKRPTSVRNEIGNSRYRKILERDNYCCQICGEKVTAIYDRVSPPTQEERTKDTACEIDHIIPRVEDGKTVESNLQVTHRKCNRDKGKKMPNGAIGVETKHVQQEIDSPPVAAEHKSHPYLVNIARYLKETTKSV